MSEHFPVKGRRARQIAASAAMLGVGLGLAGCSTSGNNSGPVRHSAVVQNRGPAINPCLTRPAPQAKGPAEPGNPPNDVASPNWQAQDNKWEAQERAWGQVDSPSPMTLKMGSTDTIAGDPISLPDSQQNIVNAATVKVEDSQGSGTGFIVRGKNGQKVIVTAAHVIAGAQGPIKIVNYEGGTADIAGGCYIYQDGTKAIPLRPSSNDTEPINMDDMAILTTSTPIQGPALAVSSIAPPRGTWINFTNDQETLIGQEPIDGQATNPTSYEGLVLTNPANSLGFVALTGVQSFLGKSLITSYSLMPGASGGEATVGTTVVGMSITSEENNSDMQNGVVDYIDASTLSGEYNVNLSPAVARNPGILPNDANLVPGSSINYALAHGNY
jgi:hypothetical protein